MRTGYIIAAVAAALLSIAAYVWSNRSDYHDFTGRCLECHLSVPSEGRGEPRVFLSDISRLCLKCHTEAKELSHPVDRVPSMSVPAGYPLDWKGELTCVTCHYAHRDGYGDFHLRGRAGGPGFCITCHDDLESGAHTGGIGTAHLIGDTTRRYIALENDRSLDNLQIDDLSLRCLSCHDALFANDSLVETRQTAIGYYHNENSIGLSHPIGVSYADAKRKYFGAYRNISDLPPQIRFFNGMVGCGSCHNPYSKEGHYQLVMSNRGSALCLACHRK